MAAPSMVSRDGENVLVKSVDAVFGASDDGEERDDSSQEGASGTEEPSELPQCKIKRNYSCASCDYYTQNPRFYLYHQKQVHKEKIKIFECPHCLYASKHSQKLQRHIHMVHIIKKKSSKNRVAKPRTEKVRRKSQSPQIKCDPEDNEGEGEEKAEPMFASDGTQIYKCSVCDMTSKSQTLVARHERIVHLKKKFFRCSKCNYMTHMKARYTKHVKYHSMPMIKCDMCDFKTPYKWNLDRHNKNHQGDGAFKCVMCNFAADIKQSLTVHEMNHHVPPVGHVAGNRRRLRVGASDTMGMITEEDGIDQEELDLLKLEREGSLDQIEQNPGDFLQTQLDEVSPPPPPPQPMMKFSMRQVLVPVGKMLTDKTQNNNRGLIQIQKYKCKTCDFSGNLGEVQRHEAAVHGLNDFASSLGPVKKAARPIPNLIPIQGQSVLKPASERKGNDSNDMNSSLKDFASIMNETRQNEMSGGSMNGSEKSDSPTPFDDKRHNESFKRKNASFFDKLKEKLMTNASERDLTCPACGFEAKCLSEHLKHQKSHHNEGEEENGHFFQTELSSTRCQYCRHRCKTSSDLKIHLQTCSAVPNNLEGPQIKTEPEDPDDSEMRGLNDEDHEDGMAHPMENKVFVWNNFSPNGSEVKAPAPFELNFHQRHEERLAIEASQLYASNTNGRYEEQPYYQRETTRKVFKCPSCSFWASTASRFHVHIVGHLNKRPFQCSLCHYSSNWRWDITKHIRLKQMRDSAHEKARVLLTDEAGRRNYSKYNKYLVPISNEEFKKAQQPRRILPKDNMDPIEPKRNSNKRSIEEQNEEERIPKKKVFTENKKTMWKCKKCFFRNSDRGVVLAHVKEHYRNIHENKTPTKQDEYHSFSNELSSPNANNREESEDDASRQPSFYENEDNVDCPDFMCETCPYFCDSLAKLEDHAERHFVTQGSNVKCQFCPYYVENAQQLMEHLDLHENSDTADDLSKNVVFACLQCPYVGTTHKQLVYHRQWHFKNLPHKCFKCNYSTHTNIILSLHVRLHRRTTLPEGDSVSNKTSETVIAADISGIDTSGFSDIPMVWVSKPMGISKMFKCRFCPHVNMRKSNIQEHEKMHASRNHSNSNSGQGSNGISIQHHCPDCNYICNNAGVLSSHMKVHQAFFGQVCGVVDHKKSDEEQIEEMKKKVSDYEASLKQKIGGEEQCKESQADESLASSDNESKDGLVLHFCPICPARFLFVKEVIIHLRFHDLNLPFKCESCSYTARQKQHLLAHLKVHTDEYQERTTVLCSMYSMDKNYPKPKVAVVLGDPAESVWNWKSESIWVVVKNEEEEENNKKEIEESKSKPLSCDKCPAEFYKQLALDYHKSLHGGPGQHKCRYCDYAVKTYGNLMRHEAVHVNGECVKLNQKSGDSSVTETEHSKQPRSEVTKGSPLKPIPAPTQEDPEFGSLIFGNPDYIYPAYIKNGRLREKRYKCHKCPSAFEKREQYKIHLSLHGSQQRYNCEKCDYSVKYFANYSQHLKKHQLSESLKKEKSISGGDPVVEDREIDETNEIPSAERCGKSLKMSVADQQTMMLLQNRNITNTVTRDNINGDVISRCPHCPYANNRKDGVNSHIKCHSNTKHGPYMCKFCDYNVPQLHFLREHLKIHFSTIKFVKPDAYMKCERLELWSEPLDSNHNTEKKLIFRDQGLDKKDRFVPLIEYPDDFDSIKGRVYINLKTGEEEVELDDEEEGVGEEEEEYEEMETGDVANTEERMEIEENVPSLTQESTSAIENGGSPVSSSTSDTSEDNSCDSSSSGSTASSERTSVTNVSQD